MLQYTAEQLLLLRRYDVKPQRTARKVIFRILDTGSVGLIVQRLGKPTSRDGSSHVLSTNIDQLRAGC